MKRILLIHLLLILAAGCSHIPKLDDVLPDKRTEYKKSEALPDLEVPPDLTSASENTSMSVPGEGQATLSEYKKEQTQRREQTQNRGQPTPQPEPGMAPVVAAAVPAENQWVAVRGSTMDIWPELRRFLADKGYSFDLDDAELGILGTNWSGPLSSDGSSYRNRYKVFTEAGAEPDIVVLYVTCERQEQIGNDWLDRDEDIMAGRLMVGELNLHFNNSAMQVTPALTPAATARRDVARLEDSGDGKLILVIPEEFTYAWKQAGSALQQSGLLINRMDRDRGIYTVAYVETGAKKKKGWISKLAFWKGADDNKGKIYQISLTGMGKMTELIILDASGNWRNDQDANNLLRMIESNYNAL
jgi:outer membrane protein assembly factor BamC